jgi:aryl-alcohol dehydrogenase-like predicted oxidoreductase
MHYPSPMTPQIPQRKLGPFTVSAIGMGCMPLSFPNDRNPGLVDRPEEAIATIHAALDAGITLLDTADIYAPSWNTMGHNELLVGKAFASWNATPEQKAKVVITTKAGITREKDGTMFGKGGRNATRNYLYRAVEASAYKLGLSKIPLWQHHRTDPLLSYEEQFENVMSLKEHGYVQEIGLSNVNAAMLRHAITAGGTPAQGGIISVQNEYSPNYHHWAEVIDICTEYGIAFLPWSPLGGGQNFAQLGSGQIGGFKAMADAKGVSPYALTIAWHLAQFPTAIPIPGASKASSILDSLSGVHISLSADEIAALNASCPTDTPLNAELFDIAKVSGE